MASVEERMLRAGVRVSPVRMLLLREMERRAAPVSAKELEEALQTVDRSSITRSLSLLVANDILHAIDDGSGTVKYELCRGEHGHSLADQHVHFHCNRCGRTVCLPNVEVHIGALPDGFEAQNANMLLSGLCPGCAAKY